MLDDPDRYVIALMFAFQALYRLSLRKAAELAIAWAEGREVPPPQNLQCQPGWAWVSFAPPRRAYKKEPAKPTLRRFEMRGRHLMRKAGVVRPPAEASWLGTMTRALMLTIDAGGAKDLDTLTMQVRSLTHEIGEDQFAERCLLPALGAVRRK